MDGDGLAEAVGAFPAAELVWVQEEPANQGAWTFMAMNAVQHLGGRTLRPVSRPASASPAVGSQKKHQAEQAAVIAAAFDR